MIEFNKALPDNFSAALRLQNRRKAWRYAWSMK
jgi:hypothetical protein